MDYSQTPVPKQVHYIWLGSIFERFDYACVRQCARNNPDYKIYIWIDDLSMLNTQEIPKFVEHMDVRAKDNFRCWAEDMAKAAPIRPEGMTSMLQSFMLFQEYYNSLVEDHSPGIFKSITAVKKFQDFIDLTSLVGCENLSLRYMSTDFYGPVISKSKEARFRLARQASSNSTAQQNYVASTVQFLEWAHRAYQSDPNSSESARFQWGVGQYIVSLEWALFERYRGNYGAASNILRVLLLEHYPGIYMDHDDPAPTFGELRGFRYARSADHLPTNSFLASAPDHPFIRFLRDRIVMNYNGLLKEYNVQPQYSKLEQPTDPEDLENPYIIDTYFRSGPGAFANALRVAMIKYPRQDLGKGWLKGMVVRPPAVKTWALRPDS